MNSDYTKPVVTSDCHGCGLCVDACSEGAISMVDVDGKTRAVIDHTKCKMHRSCIAICPVEAIGEPYPPKWGE